MTENMFDTFLSLKKVAPIKKIYTQQHLKIFTFYFLLRTRKRTGFRGIVESFFSLFNLCQSDSVKSDAAFFDQRIH